MGIYVNPPKTKKEDWLMLHGDACKHGEEAIAKADFLVSFPVCLVDNGRFTAAGVCDTLAEANRFNHVGDTRPKIWFVVPAERLTKSIIGEPYAKHLQSLAR